MSASLQNQSGLGVEPGWGSIVFGILNEQLEVALTGLVAFPTMPQS